MSADPPAETQRQHFEAVVRSERGPLFAVAFSILRDAHEAEDAVQDTLETAWRAWGSLREQKRAHAWLTRICVRRCIGIRRKLLRRVFLREGDDRAQASDRFDAGDPDLDRAFRQLTPRQRAIVTLHYRQGYSLDESASLMGCRSGTARSHLSRALRTLRKELGYEQA
jgi:RNA polymerase sigma factor (sigma-70 family)